MTTNTLYHGYEFANDLNGARYQQLMRDALDALEGVAGKDYARRFFNNLPRRSACYKWATLEAEFSRYNSNRQEQT